MRTPRTGSEVDADWLKMVVETYEGRTNQEASFSVKNFGVKPATKPGENFNSSLYAIEIDGVMKEKEEMVDKHYSLILKFHSSNTMAREVNKFNDNHMREMKLYCSIHQKLNDYQEKECGGEYSLSIPTFFYAYAKGEDYVLAIQNLKPLGYVLNDRNNGLNFNQLDLAIRQLARWHALSYVYNKKFNLLQDFPELQSGIKNYYFLFHVVEIMIKNIRAFISEHIEFKELSTKLQNEKEIIEKLKDKLFVKDFQNELCCITHGDFWNNNILYLYGNDNDVPTDVSIIDWQMSSWNSLVVDLQYLLHTSTSYQVRKDHTEKLLLTYYEIFSEITSRLQSSCPDLTYESFKRGYDDASIIGFIFGICLAQGTLSKAGETLNASSSDTPMRGALYKLKSKLGSSMTSLSFNPAMSFLIKAAIKKKIDPVHKELMEGSNSILNKRVCDLLQEAVDNHTLDSIPSI